MYDPVLMDYASEHYELRVKAAERAQRLSQLIQDEPGLARRLLGKLGHLLVRTGERLQREYAPEMGSA
jgi:hypothetical protein